jgi:uncharacterized RDD family membrane protein YckC
MFWIFLFVYAIPGMLLLALPYASFKLIRSKYKIGRVLGAMLAIICALAIFWYVKTFILRQP